MAGSDRIEKIIRSILSTGSLVAAANEAGISLRTLRRWRSREDFQERLRKAQREALELTIARAEAVGDEGLDVLRAIASDASAPATARVAAAKALDARRWKAAEVGDLRRDLDEVRQALQERAEGYA